MLIAIGLGLLSQPVAARTLLKNICRVKGQEENSLRGLGLVVGLKGTGDSGEYLPTMRALARAMELMGNPLSQPSGRGKGGLAELKNTKNVALVWVTATVPATGARNGDQLNCTVSAIGAKSLAGGRLVFAALQGPNLQDPRVYALCEGRVELDNSEYPTEGKIHRGCRMEQDVFNLFQQDGKLTLVLDKNHADFQVAYEVAQAINTQLNYTGGSSDGSYRDTEIAMPIDSSNIVVVIPPQYREVPVEFVAQVMDLPIFELNTEARVVINERAASIVFGGDVEIGPVIVTHKNIVVDTTIPLPRARFVPIDPEEITGAKLKSLVAALDALKVPPEDVIEIIKGIERNGKLHGRLIVE
jgi:flagellar P-ring protein precursor FlgI